MEAWAKLSNALPSNADIFEHLRNSFLDLRVFLVRIQEKTFPGSRVPLRWQGIVQNGTPVTNRAGLCFTYL